MYMYFFGYLMFDCLLLFSFASFYLCIHFHFFIITFPRMHSLLFSLIPFLSYTYVHVLRFSPFKAVKQSQLSMKPSSTMKTRPALGSYHAPSMTQITSNSLMDPGKHLILYVHACTCTEAIVHVCI